MNTSATVFRKDYRPYSHTIDKVELDFILDPESTLVTSVLLVTPMRGASTSDLVLDAQELSFEQLLIDGVEATGEQFTLTDTSLTVKHITKQTRLTISNRFNPTLNTALSGIYMSKGAFMSQCEAEGFRRITYWPDRPDVMSRFTVTVHADKNAYPILLSNGNLVDHGSQDNNFHWARWEDPFKKPSYLFALVAGDFADRSEKFLLKNGKECLLQVWTEKANYEKSAHALESLKKAIRWDEERWGLELDLDRFMIVATDDFNFGAMENKGLNVFNSRYVMATPQIATDADYNAIESVVGHEYFHNWTGDRVTLRDWFQLTLKEGLTVFRDQEFSMDMAPDETSRAVQRIHDVRALRSRQFPEDASPMAHPIRPEAYKEINNFYTMTVYEKGAEVIRMLQTLLGRVGFRKGLDLYISRYDGNAVTCDNFIEAMAEANEVNLSQFSLWWSQAGTPRVSVETSFDPTTSTYTVRASQTTPATPGQTQKQPLLIPISIGLIDAQGQDLPLTLRDEQTSHQTTYTLELSEESGVWTFANITSEPVISIGRGFSAPVIFDYDYSREQLCFLAQHDSDAFNRCEAMTRLALDVLNEMIDEIERGLDPTVSECWLNAFGTMLKDETLSPAFRATALAMPSEEIISRSRAMINPEAVHKAWTVAQESIGKRFSQYLSEVYANNRTPGPYQATSEDVGKRTFKNSALSYWLAGGNAKSLLMARDQFERADNLTDRLSALQFIVNSQSPAKVDVLNTAASQWINEPLLMNKWFTVQAVAQVAPDECPVVERIRALMQYDVFSIANPNNVYALVLAFCTNNPAEFHRADGSGYAFWTEMVLKLDKVNNHVAARLARAMDHWRRYSPKRAHLMHAALTEVASVPTLSTAVREIVEKALNNN